MKPSETGKPFVHKKIETLLGSRYPKARELVGFTTTRAEQVTLELGRILLHGIDKFISTRNDEFFEECKLEMAELIDRELGAADPDLVQTCALEFLDDFVWKLKNER